MRQSSYTPDLIVNTLMNYTSIGNRRRLSNRYVSLNMSTHLRLDILPNRPNKLTRHLHGRIMAVFFGEYVDGFLGYKMGMWDPRIHYTADGGLPPYDEVMKRGTMKRAFVLMYITASAYYVSLYFIKMTFLFLYRQIFPVDMKKLRFAVNFTIGLVTAGYGVVVGMMFFWCLPVSRNLKNGIDMEIRKMLDRTMNPKDRCLTWAAVTPYFFGIRFHVITDLLVYALPFFILPRLYNSCSRPKFIGVVAMFSLGLICILCTVARIVNAGMDSSAEVIAVWCTAEITASTITACICILPIKRLYDVKRHRRGSDAGIMGNKKGGGKKGGGGRSGSRSWTRSRSWSKSFGWMKGQWNGSGTGNGGDVEGGGDGSKMWTRGTGDADTLDTRGGGTVLSGVEGGLAPRKDTAGEARVMSVRVKGDKNNSDNGDDKEDGKKQGYFTRLLRKGDKTNATTDKSENDMVSIRVPNESTQDDSAEEKEKKKKKREEMAILTFGGMNSPGVTTGPSPTIDTDGIYPMSTPTGLPQNPHMLSPQGSTFAHAGSREHVGPGSSSSSLQVDRGGIGQEDEGHVSVGSLTFGPKRSTT